MLRATVPTETTISDGFLAATEWHKQNAGGPMNNHSTNLKLILDQTTCLELSAKTEHQTNKCYSARCAQHKIHVANNSCAIFVFRMLTTNNTM